MVNPSPSQSSLNLQTTTSELVPYKGFKRLCRRIVNNSSPTFPHSVNASSESTSKRSSLVSNRVIILREECGTKRKSNVLEDEPTQTTSSTEEEGISPLPKRPRIEISDSEIPATDEGATPQAKRSIKETLESKAAEITSHQDKERPSAGQTAIIPGYTRLRRLIRHQTAPSSIAPPEQNSPSTSSVTQITTDFQHSEKIVLLAIRTRALADEYLWNTMEKDVLERLRTCSDILSVAWKKLTGANWPDVQLSIYETFLIKNKKNSFVENRILNGKTPHEECLQAQSAYNRFVMKKLAQLEPCIDWGNSLPEEEANTNTSFKLPPRTRKNATKSLWLTSEQERLSRLLIANRSWHGLQKEVAKKQDVCETQITCAFRPANTTWPEKAARVYFNFIKDYENNIYVKLRILQGKTVDQEIKAAWDAYDETVIARMNLFLDKGIADRFVPNRAASVAGEPSEEVSVSSFRQHRVAIAQKEGHFDERPSTYFQFNEVVLLKKIICDALAENGVRWWLKEQKPAVESFKADPHVREINRKILSDAFRKLLEDKKLNWLAKDLSTYCNDIDFYSKNQFIQREILKGRTIEQEKQYALNVMNLKIFIAFKKWSDELELSPEITQAIDAEITQLKTKTTDFKEKKLGLPKLKTEEITTEFQNVDRENVVEIYILDKTKKVQAWHFPQAEACNYLKKNNPSQDRLSASWRGTKTPWPYHAWDTFRSFLDKNQTNIILKLRVLKGEKPEHLAERAWQTYDSLLKKQLETVIEEWKEIYS